MFDLFNVELFLMKSYSMTVADLNNMPLLDFDYYYNKTLRDIEEIRNKNKNKGSDEVKTPFAMIR